MLGHVVLLPNIDVDHIKAFHMVWYGGALKETDSRSEANVQKLIISVYNGSR